MSVDAGIVNQNARTVKKELTDLLKPLNDTLQRLQALRCSVDCVFNFLQGKIEFIFCVRNSSLGHPWANFGEILGINRVDSELVQRQLFDFQVSKNSPLP